jgi:hypothetical protein
MRYALIYGAIAGAIVIAIIVAGLAFDLPNHFQSQWFGYLVMLAALSLIFVGVKRYRDIEYGGVVGFGRAFTVGLGIAVVAGVIYVVGWEAYLAGPGRSFMAEYTGSMLAEMRANGASAAEIAAMEAQVEQMTAIYRQPLLRFLVTFGEIFPVGLLVALVSALVLRNPRVLPARVN